MGTKDRLERLTGEKKIESGSALHGDGARAGEIRALRDRIEAVLSRRPEGRTAETPTAGRGRGVPLEELVSGEERVTEGGRFFCARRLTGGSSRHGRFCIRDLAPLDMGRIAVLANDPDLQGVRLPAGLLPRYGDDRACRRNRDGRLSHRDRLVRKGCLRDRAALRPGLRRGAGDAPLPPGSSSGRPVSWSASTARPSTPISWPPVSS